VKKWNVLSLAAFVSTIVAIILAGVIATSPVAGEGTAGNFDRGTTLTVPF
jgi:uncharacterized membrane protein